MNAAAGTPHLPVIRANAEGFTDARPAKTDVSVWTRAMLRGDEAAWLNFYREYSGRILRYLLVLLKGDHEVATEVLQVTFTRIARHLREFSDEATLWPWLTRLARTALIDELRKRGRREESLRELEQEPANTRAEADDWSELLHQALRQMDERERALLERKYLRGESVREIAAAAGESEKVIESRMTRARGKLRAIMLELLQGEE